MGVALTDLRDLLGHSRSTTTDEYLDEFKSSTKEAIKKIGIFEMNSPIKSPITKKPTWEDGLEWRARRDRTPDFRIRSIVPAISRIDQNVD